MTKINITIPIWNEAKILAKSLPLLIDILKKTLGDEEWFVVLSDNGSTDSTAWVVQDMIKSYSNVFYYYSPNRGRGLALKESWGNFPADFYGYIDADMDIHPQAIILAFNQLSKEGYDLAIGSRAHEQSSIVRSWHRSFFTSLSSLLVRSIFPKIPQDTQCGIKLLTKNVVSRIVPSIQETGWFFDTELILRSKKDNYRIAEIPVDIKNNRLGPRDSTVSLGKDGLKFLFCILKFKKMGL